MDAGRRRLGTLWIALAVGVCAAAATALVLALITRADDPASDGGSGQARNVIFLHGDGMGISARELVRLVTKGRDGQLAMNQLRYAGWSQTDPDDPGTAVTDSAAGGTALSTGVRTENGSVGVAPNGHSVPTLLERARASGRATGLVTTSQVTDASPAAFAAHVEDRGDQSEIARQYLEKSKPDVILGGGEDWWLPEGNPGAWPDNPPTDREERSIGGKGDLIARARDLGYAHVSSADELRSADSPKLLGLFANEQMFEQRPEGEGDLYEPAVSLRDMTAKALDVLSRDPEGLFLFVEEEATDEMAHNNNAKLTLEAGRALDETVAHVVDWAKDHPDTLIVVAADHETGGLTIENADDTQEPPEDGPFQIANSDLQFTVDWTTGEHSGAAVPVTAEGPGAERLARAQKNTEVHDAIAAAMGLKAD